MIDEHDARWLVSAAGLDVVAALDAVVVDGGDTAVLLRRAHAAGATDTQARAAVDATLARQRARPRWADADRLLFTRESLEEATDPAISAWKARRLVGRPVLDVCAGIGGDATAFARSAARVEAIEGRPGRAVLLGHNARARQVEVTVRIGDALALDPPSGGVVHADPDRRADGRRVRDPRRYRPAVGALIAHFRALDGLATTLAAGVAPEDPLLDGAEVEFVQVGADLKEATAWFGGLRDGAARASATLLPTGEHRVRVGPASTELPTRDVGAVLLTPAPALVRARLHDEVGAELGPSVGRLARTRALLTGDDPVVPSPWFRARPVRTVLPLDPRRVAAWLRASGDGAPVEIAVHGLDLDPVVWWRAIGRPPRGPLGLRVELVRLDRGSVAILTDDGPPTRTAPA